MDIWDIRLIILLVGIWVPLSLIFRQIREQNQVIRRFTSGEGFEFERSDPIEELRRRAAANEEILENEEEFDRFVLSEVKVWERLMGFFSGPEESPREPEEVENEQENDDETHRLALLQPRGQW